MGITFDEAMAEVTAAGGQFEIGDAIINGSAQKVFVKAPPNLGTLFVHLPLLPEQVPTGR